MLAHVLHPYPSFLQTIPAAAYSSCTAHIPFECISNTEPTPSSPHAGVRCVPRRLPTRKVHLLLGSLRSKATHARLLQSQLQAHAAQLQSMRQAHAADLQGCAAKQAAAMQVCMDLLADSAAYRQHAEVATARLGVALKDGALYRQQLQAANAQLHTAEALLASYKAQQTEAEAQATAAQEQTPEALSRASSWGSSAPCSQAGRMPQAQAQVQMPGGYWNPCFSPKPRDGSCCSLELFCEGGDAEGSGDEDCLLPSPSCLMPPTPEPAQRGVLRLARTSSTVACPAPAPAPVKVVAHSSGGTAAGPAPAASCMTISATSDAAAAAVEAEAVECAGQWPTTPTTPSSLQGGPASQQHAPATPHQAQRSSAASHAFWAGLEAQALGCGEEEGACGQWSLLQPLGQQEVEAFLVAGLMF